MSGHSKWATTKHKKAALDKTRGKLFAKLIRQVEVAAREGGGDLDSNSSLRTMYQKARDSSVPLDTIERAIKRGTGDLEGVRYEAIAYEGYAPAGVAVYVECLTDNRNRTGAEIRSIFSKSGGSIAEPGAVSWQFNRAGVVVLPGNLDEDEVMLVALDAGADDLTKTSDFIQLTCPTDKLHELRTALEGAGFSVERSDLTMVPSTVIELTEEGETKKVLRLIDALEDHDDVQNVYANFDASEEILEAVLGA